MTVLESVRAVLRVVLVWVQAQAPMSVILR